MKTPEPFCDSCTTIRGKEPREGGKKEHTLLCAGAETGAREGSTQATAGRGESQNVGAPAWTGPAD